MPKLSGSARNDDFHGLLCVDEPFAEPGLRQKTLIEASEDAVPVARNHVVNAVPEGLRQDVHQGHQPPRPSKLPGDEERRVAPREHTRPRSVEVGAYVKRCERVGIASPTVDDGPAGRALQRRKHKDATMVVPQQELQQPVAKAAHPVIEHEVHTLYVRSLLRR